MKVKNKLRAGFGFLFIVVMLFGAVSLYYINRISANAKVILKDNYETLGYCREMRTILDENSLPLNADAIAQFNAELKKEAHNLTEPGEKEVVINLTKAFISLQKNELSAEKTTRKYLRQIEAINMQAIVSKNDKAQASVEESTLFLGLAAAFTFLVLFSFSVNFPGIILNPLNTLLKGIRAVGQKNYNERIHFDQNDEFAEVGKAFNDMAIKLNDWENSN